MNELRALRAYVDRRCAKLDALTNTGLMLTLVLVFGCATSADNAGKDARPPNLGPVAGEAAEKTASTLYGMARVMVMQGKIEEAEEYLIRLTTRYPTYAPGYVALAELRLSQGRLTEATATLEQAVVAVSRDMDLVNDLGVCYLMGADYESALELFNEACAFAPGNQKYRANRALALGLLGRTDEAYEQFGQLMSGPDVLHNMQVIAEITRPRDTSTGLQEHLDAP